jgi:REP element-mobilizing transposase RayT
MSHTYSSMRIHVVFSTKERQKRLREEPQPKLWAYIAGIATLLHAARKPNLTMPKPRKGNPT